jgi:hypothetical protein
LCRILTKLQLHGDALNLGKSPAKPVPPISFSLSVIQPRFAYAWAMRIFFEGWDEIDAFLERLAAMRCPACGASGTFARHGFVYGHLDDRGAWGVRARRIRCRPKKGGCGKTWSLRPGARLFRFCFGTQQAWNFLREVLAGRSVKAA